MPWRESDAVSERLEFIAAHRAGLYTMTELCARFGISRKSGYARLARYAAEGAAGLLDRSHAPHTCPHRIAAEVEAALLEVRRVHPTWGPKKLLAYLAPRRPELRLPAPSSVGEMLSRHGLVQPRKRRGGRAAATARDLHVAQAPNEVWSLDFKGEFRTGDGLLCYPLTVQDVYSRYLLGLCALGSTAGAGARVALEAVFREYGLPQVLRSDNGVPFVAPHALARGLSRLRVWWIKLGILHERIAPGRPDQNGRHERMHRTLKAETARPPAADHPAQQVRFDAWGREFNQERPHEALGQRPPQSVYTPALRSYPERLSEPEYAGHCEVRQVRRGGEINFCGAAFFLSETLAGEAVALEEVEDGRWAIWFYDQEIARFDERTRRVG